MCVILKQNLKPPRRCKVLFPRLPGATLLTFDLVGLPSIILPRLVEASVSAWILAAIPSGVFETAKQSKGSGPQLALSTCA